MSESLRRLYKQHYAGFTTPDLYEEAQALFQDHSVSADLSTSKFRVVVVELTRRGVVFIAEKINQENVA